MTDAHIASSDPVDNSIYSVVYQMGKVASTSIVATLNDLPGIEAVQSHFLGESALSAIVPQITGADVPEYFFKHGLGQFVENMQITRRINLSRAGKKPGEKLLIISLCRDPVEWTRSSVVQDIQGYLPVLKAICDDSPLDYSSDSEAVKSGLDMLIHEACVVLERFGGIDGFLASGLPFKERFEKTIFQDNPDTARLLMMFMRPANWFDTHFQPALSIKIDDMEKEGLVWSTVEGDAYFVIARYEEMSQTLPEWLRAKGLCEIDEFKRENVSATKPFAKEVALAFDAESGQRLRGLYKDTRYSRFFSYS